MEFEGILFKMKNIKILEDYRWGWGGGAQSMVRPELA